MIGSSIPASCVIQSERVVPTLLIRFQVNDFETWKREFFDEKETRRANGSQAEFFFRNAANPGDIWILLEWDDLFRAQLFVKSDDLIEAMIRAGVADQPDFWFLEGNHHVSF